MPLSIEAYVIGAVIALPLLARRRWPLQVLCASFLLMVAFYILDRRNISPAPLMFVPTYEAALAGYLAWAITLPALIMVLGLIWVGILGSENTVVLLWDFLPSFAVFVLAVTLGEVIRSRRELAAETVRRLQIAEDERRSDAARLLAEERLRIARELHDTVAHSMATIAVQAGLALHVLSSPRSPEDPGQPPAPARVVPPNAQLHDALTAIRETSKTALVEMRAVLGQLREDNDAPPPEGGDVSLSRAPGLCAAVSAAGSPVALTCDGGPKELPPAIDHVAYRILQESLTNVLRHTPPGTPAHVRLRYAPDVLTITVADDGPAAEVAPPLVNGRHPSGAAEGNGIRGMRERAASVNGTLAAGSRPGGGFTVTAALPVTVKRPGGAPVAIAPAPAVTPSVPGIQS
jgi:signal transduction histidine kinase